MEEIRNAYKILVGKLERKGHLGNLGVYGKVVLKWILEKRGVKMWTGLIWLKIGSNGGLLCKRQ
jgi:hypothetical protein